MTTPTQAFPTDTTGLPKAVSPQRVDLADGAEFALRIAPVAKQVGESSLRMLAYNGSIPGPTLWVRQGSELTVHTHNQGDLEATVHWHGLRLDNRFDGTSETQTPMPVDGSFTYRLQFPDPGVYWYHPHIREDYGQELGLYGNIVVVPSDPTYWPRVHRELTLTLDDVLLEHGRIAPFDRAQSNYTAMGRFGNTFLVQGETETSLSARRGEVLRFYLTNTANARVFNVAFRSARMKVVGGDSGRVERETFVDSVVIAPSERIVVDILFDEPGAVLLEHRTPHRTYTLGTIEVLDQAAEPALEQEFMQLRTNSDLARERDRIQGALTAPPTKTLALVAEMDLDALVAAPSGELEYACPMHPEVRSDHADHCPKCHMKLVPALLLDHADDTQSQHAHNDAVQGGIEWEDDMVAVNRLTTPANTRWKLIDRATGAEGTAIAWKFRVGDQVKIRLVNEMDSDHPMHHPFHIHGAGRFLVLSRDATPEPNLVWKDTVLVPTGQVVDILLDVTNPGRWMAHCHIAEHHESGMMLSFDVEARNDSL